jgi:hypothetical protein
MGKQRLKSRQYRCGEIILPTRGTAGKKQVNIDTLRLKIWKIPSDASYMIHARKTSKK